MVYGLAPHHVSCGMERMRELAKLEIGDRVVQVALDFTNIDDALRVGELAVRAGVDWLEAGTPLVTFVGTSCIGALAHAFPGMPVLADFKTMDGARKYVLETAAQGGHIATVCAVSSDATISTTVQAGTDAEIAVICDLSASHDVAVRAREVEALGVDSVYVHWGSDQRVFDPSRDPQLDLPAVVESVNVPVGIATFCAEEGARAIRTGAKICVIGFPLIGQPDALDALKRYVDAVKSA
jgi:3-hexulose-6-phosphate synthase